MTGWQEIEAAFIKKTHFNRKRQSSFCFVVCVFFIVAAISLVLSGCGQTDGPDTDGKKTDKVQITDEKITVGLSQIGSESDWRMASTASVRSAFSSAAGYDLIFDDAQQKQENQLKAIREFIDQGVDYIILDPIVETGWDSVLSEAKEAGIPVIVYDRRIEVDDDSLYTCWIGSDFKLEGERACVWLQEYLESSGVDRNINIVDMQGTPGASAQIGRTAALEEAVMLNKNWRIIAQDTGDFTTAKGKEVMVDWLTKYGSDINVVYAENDNMAYGAIEAIEARGYKVGLDIDNGEFMVVSFDSSHNGLQLTLNGKIAVNTECNPLYGPRLTEIIQTLESGGSVEKETYIEEEQFSGISYIGTIQVRNHPYTVTHLTENIISDRQY
ncbi:MAG: ABC transporter substrate-binding protein [Lachnospiraceae bacterium]|nr:ABC transporter substrate-binding protein [Lachnospiraceae bacterium]